MIRIVTDSTCYIPDDIIKAYRIPVVPLKIQLGRETYDEITGISNADFYRQFIASQNFPTTSQPSSAEFKAAYQQICQQEANAEILVLTTSSKLSGTYNSAVKAASQMPEISVTVFDSLSVAMGLGLMVLTAASMAKADRGLSEIIYRLEQMRRETRIVLVVDTLEYLKRGGRIGTAGVFLGTLLNTKPILGVVNGELRPLARVRSKQKALDRLLAELESKLANPDQPVQAAVMHVLARAEMEALAAMMKVRFNITRIFTSELGPVIGAHIGPGALGAGICPNP